MVFLFLYSTQLVEIVLNFMSVQINYKSTFKKNSTNSVLFVDEKYSISALKKFISNSEYSFVLDLLKTRDLKKKITSFDINSKRKIILVSLKKNLKNSEVENLGAKFYDLYRELKQNEFILNSDSLSNQHNNIIGHFLHGIKLKSYKFEKYKTKKNKNKIYIAVIGKNIPNIKNQFKFNAIEEGTFYTRDLVSEPGNVLHPDEYAKRINSLKKFGLKINIFDEKKLKK